MSHFLVGFRQNFTNYASFKEDHCGILQGLVHFFTDSPKEDIWPDVVCVFFAFMEKNMFICIHIYIYLLVGTLFGYILK